MKEKLSTILQFKNGKKRPKEEGFIPVYGGNGILGYTNESNYKNCIIVGRVGAYCGSVFYEKNACWISDNAIAALAKKNADIIYAYYLLKSLHLNERRIGTSQPLLTQEILNKIEVDILPYEEQKKVGRYLNRFDEAITLNEAINKNYDQQARALFQEMFITSEERHGWKNGVFADLIESTLGGDWGKEFPTGNYTEMVYCIRGADIQEVRTGNKGKMPTRYILPKNYVTKRLLPGDIVVEISGGSPTQSTGRVAVISESLLDRYDKGMVCTNFCRAIKPKAGYSMFVYYYWQYLYDRNVFFSYENGTTGIKNLDLSGFINTEKIVIPPLSRVEEFDTYCQTFFAHIFANGLENEQLTTMRDTLMPRLISGEIDVSQIPF